MKNYLIPQRRSLAKTLASGLLVLAQVIAPLAHAETISYQHDNNGNITQRASPLGTTTYTYDALGRLISEAGPAKTQSITYDANGNRLSDGAGTYTYAPTSNRMLTRRGLAVTTDVLGNITADGTGREYVFNQARQLAQVKQGGILIATYTYDHAGLRISKVTTASAPQGAQTVISEYDEQGHLIAEFSGTGAPIRAYIWLADTPLSQIEYVPSRKIYSFNVDHLNTPRSLMDDTGETVWRWESDAFGSTLPNEDADGDGVKITSNLRFPGQYYDKETGLHYNWHRYYDPTTGQYIQADPIGLAAGTNLYTYVDSSPLNFIDPFGLETQLCIRPLGKKPAGRTAPVINHTYGCVGNPKDGWTCNSTTASSSSVLDNMWPFGDGSAGKPTDTSKDYYDKNSCTKVVDDSNCVEQCIKKKWKKPRPWYRVGPKGTDCQEYTYDVIISCESSCKRK